MKEKFITDIENSIKKNWNKPALSNFQGEDYNYQKVADRIIYLHYIFKKAGIKKGDKITLIGINSINWAIVYLSTVSYGAVIVPILPDFKADDIHHIVNHSDASLLFCAGNIYDSLEESKMTNLKGIFVLENLQLMHHKKSQLSQAVKSAESDYLQSYNNYLTPENFKIEDVKNEDLATIVYTSGTTGFSKGVMLLHNSLSANVRFAQNHMPLKAGDKIVSFMPLAHLYGCSFEFLFPLSLGCHITFLSKTPSPKVIVKAFSEIRPQLILSVPLIIEKIYKKQISPAISKGAVKYLLKTPVISRTIHKKIYNKLFDVFGANFHEIVIGGAAFNPQVETFLKTIGFPFTNGYGMTECGPLISYASWKTTKPFSVGKVVDTLEIKVDSPNPAKEPGEVMVRGENVMVGYYKNPAATNDAIDEEGWLHTGDLGLIDEDGFIFLKGRSKFMILGPSGQNIFPEELEAKLNSLKYVSESIVTERDNKLVALIYPDYEAVDEESLDNETLEKKIEEGRVYINSTLPGFANINKFELYPEEFEKTPTKKIKRFLYN
ncbi:MAG: AMP-binding protein [Calditrichaeota bacterium]|nr:AMP-binding protein [Calditrichota bacterium]